MDKRYQHDQYEKQIYNLWEKSGGFSPISDLKAKPFTIIMPPPNANDPLHIGHAMFVTVEDILIRVARMQGRATLWLPGTDHAGIETQFVFEKKLKEEGKSRFDFDRETLYGKIWDYVRENSDVAVEQLKRIGASADWSRFKFTLDKDIVEVVLDTFQKLVKDGLVYRDLSLVNYCTHCGTAFSELEVKHIERKAPFLYIKYGPFTIGTARPETKFRDTALAAHPDDTRYKKWFGKTLDVPGLLGPITMTVIKDPGVDPEFGTGMMKVTPAHDPHDFELGKKYNLPVTPIIGFDGKMDFSWFLKKKDAPQKYQERARQYHGMRVAEARKLMIQHLKNDGLLERIDENHVHTIGVCYRCGTVLEPLPLAQFFIKVKPLTNLALKALKNKDVVIYGAGHDKILKHWLEDLKDWNISRQIVWGIRQPIWYKIETGNRKQETPNSFATGQAGNNDIEVRFLDKKRDLISGKIAELLKKYSLKEIKEGLQELRAPVEAEFVVSATTPGENFIQETDTFDTWFSSGQWPFATLRTSRKGDIERFYPTQVMETAYDILIFWVMRMLMLGLYRTGKVPFEQVYLHGLVRDEKGQKMSKSKGNVINPVSVIEKYGADALRMALVMSTTAGRDSATGEEKIRGMRNFTNKIWNAARFILMKQEGDKGETLRQSRQGGIAQGDKKFLETLNKIVEKVTGQLNGLKAGLAAETLYKEFWHRFCDKCIEKAKSGEISAKSLTEGLVVFLKLLHPFVPFVTEAVWQELYEKGLVKEKLLLTAS
ncbi:MAG: valine--tRNA ligase, partial [Candidatus Chisholmbacteria bacterium]|nr:valine--tRNA ligase [Candidatus Chisholmbacteria bacterium]